MVALRRRSKGIVSAPFGLIALVFAIVPNQIGYQDLAALLARQPAVTEHWRQHVLASPFGTIHAATFSFSRPIGTAMPRPPGFQLASLDPRDITARSVAPLLEATPEDMPLEFPTVDRSKKGDRQVSLPQPQAPDSTEPPSGQETSAPEIPIAEIPDPLDTENSTAETADFAPAKPSEPVMEMARLYFGVEPLGDSLGSIEKWAPGEEPTLMWPQQTQADPDIKLSALEPVRPAGKDAEPPTAAPLPDGGQTIASKGEVTGEGRRPMSPAERLHLDGKSRVKAEKCLANAIYFESRGEAVRGQMAVAQVVMNRVFSGFYPNNVCGVVYQNAHRHLACQFTFACDGIPDIVTEPQAWIRATSIARDTLDGKYWLPEVNRATHYHAYWVRPSWIREMKKLYKFGVHTFYRPRAWGDGSDAPSWGTAAATAEAVAKL